LFFLIIKKENQMKKLVALLAVGAMVASASADLTSFNWVGGKVYDQTGTAFASGTGVVTAQTSLFDLSGFVFDNGGQLQINIADIPSMYAIADLAVAGAFAGGKYSTSFAEGDATVAGQTAYLVVKNGLGAIEMGDYIGLSASSYEIVDLQPGSDPAATPQNFSGGDVTTNIEVVPEPATIGLMGIAGLGMFLARKKSRR
jgi:hypothetical protein